MTTPFHIGATALLVLMATAAIWTTGCGASYAQRLQEQTVRPAREVVDREATTAPRRSRAAEKRHERRQRQVAGRSAPSTGRQSLVPDARDLASLDVNHRVSAGAATPGDMTLHAFPIRRIDAQWDEIRQVHCSTGQVVRSSRRATTTAALSRQTQSGVPPGIWVLEIDPDGGRRDVPDNEWFRHIAKHHRVRFIDRNRVDGTVIYRYIGPRARLGTRDRAVSSAP